jgi:hypothetical protein
MPSYAGCAGLEVRAGSPAHAQYSSSGNMTKCGTALEQNMALTPPRTKQCFQSARYLMYKKEFTYFSRFNVVTQAVHRPRGLCVMIGRIISSEMTPEPDTIGCSAPNPGDQINWQSGRIEVKQKGGRLKCLSNVESQSTLKLLTAPSGGGDGAAWLH